MTINDCRPEVQAFAVLMEARLRANDHKPGWKTDTPRALYERLEQELWELQEVCTIEPRHFIPVRRVALEAADVGNFAMMVCDACGGLPDARP